MQGNEPMKNKEPNYKYENGCAAPAMVILIILFSACTIIKEKNPSQQENTNIFAWMIIVILSVVVLKIIYNLYMKWKYGKKELKPLKRKD